MGQPGPDYDDDDDYREEDNQEKENGGDDDDDEWERMMGKDQAQSFGIFSLLFFVLSTNSKFFLQDVNYHP